MRKLRSWKNPHNFPVLLLIILYLACPVCPKEQYVEPILFGMKVSIPYDMANLFNRFPIQGVLSLFLGLGLSFILFFGVITAPFGYMFGVPSEKMVMGDYALKHPEVSSGRHGRNLELESYYTEDLHTSKPSSFLLDYIRKEKSSARTLFSDQPNDEQECCQTFLYYFDTVVGYLDYWESGFLQKWKPSLNFLRHRLGGKVGKEVISTVESTLSTQYTPDFIHSMFYLISKDEKDVNNPSCQKRILCHAHGSLQYVPVSLLKIYHKFSKKLIKIPPQFVEAMQVGMKNETLCAEAYSECQDNAFTLTLKSYLSLLPDKRQINDMPRRKHKMYNKMNFLK